MSFGVPNARKRNKHLFYSSDKCNTIFVFNSALQKSYYDMPIINTTSCITMPIILS